MKKLYKNLKGDDGILIDISDIKEVYMGYDKVLFNNRYYLQLFRKDGSWIKIYRKEETVYRYFELITNDLLKLKK